jgi:hypothetical protein
MNELKAVIGSLILTTIAVILSKFTNTDPFNTLIFVSLIGVLKIELEIADLRKKLKL